TDMPQRLVTRFGSDIIAALASRENPDLATAVERAAFAHKPDKDALKALQLRVKERASKLGIEPEVLATRRDLTAFLVGRAPPRLASGWRTAEIESLADGA